MFVKTKNLCFWLAAVLKTIETIETIGTIIFLPIFKQIFSVRKLKIVPIVSIVFKTTARRSARMNNKTKAYCLNKNSKKTHKSGFIYEP